MCVKRRKSSTLRVLDAGSDAPPPPAVHSSPLKRPQPPSLNHLPLEQTTPTCLRELPVWVISNISKVQGRFKLFSSGLSGKTTAVKTQRLIIHCCYTRPEGVRAKETTVCSYIDILYNSITAHFLPCNNMQSQSMPQTCHMIISGHIFIYYILTSKQFCELPHSISTS